MEQELEGYAQRLKQHDWTFEFSDSHAVWLRGHREQQWLEATQQNLDPKGEVWNATVPEGYRRPWLGLSKPLQQSAASQELL